MFIFALKKSSRSIAFPLCLIKLWCKNEQLFIIICIIFKKSNKYIPLFYLFTYLFYVLHKYTEYFVFVFVLHNILTYLILTIDWIV